MKKVKVAQFGLGPIGLESVALAAVQGWVELVGGVDVAADKAGRSMAEVTGNSAIGGKVHASIDALLAEVQPDIILHTASSSAAASLAQVRPALERGISVASTCEELIFPQLKTFDIAVQYDALCRQTGARVVATGVNPGFVMDLLPIVLTGVSRQVDSIYVERVVDAATRRKPLQAKIGSGRPPEEFRAAFKAGKAGHAGFQQSLALLAHAMGWKLDAIHETCEPVVADAKLKTKYFEVQAGQTRGLHQRAIGIVQGDAKLVLDLTMALGEANPHDTIVVRGRPDLHLTLNGGVAGDDATVAALINIVPRVLAAAPGIRFVTDLAAPAWSNPASAA